MMRTAAVLAGAGLYALCTAPLLAASRWGVWLGAVLWGVVMGIAVDRWEKRR